MTEEVDAEIAGQKLKISGANVSFIFTVLAAFFAAGAVWMLYTHQAEARAAQGDVVTAIREMTAAQKEQSQIMREQVCLLSLSQDKREKEFLAADGVCKRLSR